MSAKRSIRTDDIGLLLPTMQPYARAVLAKLEELGFHPHVFDTLRTSEEAKANEAKGTGSARSMHLYGAAIDIICLDHLWSCKAAKCKFYTALPREGKALGLWAGADWGDLVHLQGVPYRGVAQAGMRALGMGLDPASVAARDAYLQRYLKGLPA